MAFYSFLRKNRLYIALIIFIIAFNFFLARQREKGVSHRQANEVAAVEREELSADENGRELSDRIRASFDEDPHKYRLIVIINFLILLMIGAGLVLDGYFVKRFLSRDGPDIRTVPYIMPRWGLQDVLRTIVVMLFFGYLFVFVQLFAVDIFPLIENENFRMISNTAFMNIVGIGIILYFVTRKHAQSPEALGISARSWRKNIFYGFTGYLAIIPVLVAVMVITHYVTDLIGYEVPVQPVVRVLAEEERVPVLLFGTLFAAIFGPLAEEVFFRGFLYRALKKKVGLIWSVISTALLFAVLHAHVVGIAPIFVLGVLLAYLYEKTGSLVAPVTVHVAHNVLMLGLVFLHRGVGF